MKANVGTVDRVIRLVLGFALLLFFFLADAPARWWGLIGIVPLLTASLGWCPLYSVLGMDTRRHREGTAI